MKSAEEMPVLLRVVVGSQAHGMARADSDWDYREVFAVPTSEMLSIGRPPLKFGWMSESRHVDDEGGHEVAQFFHLVSKGAPNAVEMLFAPLDEAWESDVPFTADEPLQTVGRALLAHKPVMDGVIGYAMNSFRKIPERPGKWKAGMLRVLYQGQELLYSGDLSLGLRVPEGDWGTVVRRAATNEMTDGEALDRANAIIDLIKAADADGHRALPDKPDFDRANAWLLALRKDLWV